MPNARIFAGMATEDIAYREHAAQLRTADERRGTEHNSERAIPTLKAKAAQRTVPNLRAPAKYTYANKRLRGPLRTWPI
jgi:hypothetical protein